MAFKCYSGDSSDGKVEMTLQEFKKWLKKFDGNKDGRISPEEFRVAMRTAGVWFPNFRTKDGLKSADKNHDGFIEENEISNLQDFALKHLGVRIVSINLS